MTAVVNCTTNIDCFHTGSLDYFTFDVAFWRREVMGRLRGETQTFIRCEALFPFSCSVR